jgi:DNA-binding MurR/RpiR family transcriptional regulator
MNIGPRDLLVSISFPRYASDAVMLTRYARDRGAHVIALTDSMASPLANWSHEVLLAQATHPVLSSSYSAALLVIESLVTCLMVSGDHQVAQAEKLTDAISAYLYTDKPGNDRGTGEPPVKRIIRG